MSGVAYLYEFKTVEFHPMRYRLNLADGLLILPLVMLHVPGLTIPKIHSTLWYVRRQVNLCHLCLCSNYTMLATSTYVQVDITITLTSVGMLDRFGHLKSMPARHAALNIQQ
jgi:hypothetical protein